MIKFCFLTDLHWGYQRQGGHKTPLHDIKALKSTLKFLEDFKPDVVILGGDMLDCAAISHHNKGKPGRVEGLKLLSDAKELQESLIKPLEQLKPSKLVYITGNHERWLQDLTESEPGLEGLLDLDVLLNLGKKWNVIPQGGHFNLGKLTFIHGDQLSGTEFICKNAVIAYERNIRFGHLHSYQVYSKNSALDYKHSKTGVLVPCLCTKRPHYGGGAPNKWQQGFNWGYIDGDKFNDYVSIITDGSFTANGKTYKA